jgi:hypothetical protein
MIIAALHNEFCTLAARFISEVFEAVEYDSPTTSLVGEGSIVRGADGKEFCTCLIGVVLSANRNILTHSSERAVQIASPDVGNAFNLICQLILRQSQRMPATYATRLQMGGPGCTRKPLSRDIAQRMTEAYATEDAVNAFACELVRMGSEAARFETFKLILGPRKEGRTYPFWKERVSADIVKMICAHAMKDSDLRMTVEAAGQACLAPEMQPTRLLWEGV